LSSKLKLDGPLVSTQEPPTGEPSGSRAAAESPKGWGEVPDPRGDRSYGKLAGHRKGACEEADSPFVRFLRVEPAD